jgi:hypothetical protein
MKRKNASIQLDLFEQDEPRVLPVLSQKEQLATLVETLLLEIAAALVSGEVGLAAAAAGWRAGAQEAPKHCSAAAPILSSRPTPRAFETFARSWAQPDTPRRLDPGSVPVS